MTWFFLMDGCCVPRVFQWIFEQQFQCQSLIKLPTILCYSKQHNEELYMMNQLERNISLVMKKPNLYNSGDVNK